MAAFALLGLLAGMVVQVAVGLRKAATNGNVPISAVCNDHTAGIVTRLFHRVDSESWVIVQHGVTPPGLGSGGNLHMCLVGRTGNTLDWGMTPKIPGDDAADPIQVVDAWSRKKPYSGNFCTLISDIRFGPGINLKGTWVWRGQHIAGQEFSVTTSVSEQNDYSHAIGVGLSASASGSAGVPFVTQGSVSVTLDLSYQYSWAQSTTQGIEHSVVTQAPDCSMGNLWQYGMEVFGPGHDTISATRLPGGLLSFVCINSTQGSPLLAYPRCPAGFCYDSACQCCNGFGFAKYMESVVELVARDRGGNCDV